MRVPCFPLSKELLFSAYCSMLNITDLQNHWYFPFFKKRVFHSVLLRDWETIHIIYSHTHTHIWKATIIQCIYFSYLHTEERSMVLTVHDVIVSTTYVLPNSLKLSIYKDKRNWRNYLNIYHLCDSVTYLAKDNCRQEHVFNRTSIYEISSLVRGNLATQLFFF